MSECVVRMEMPENCECCPMVYTADVPGYHWCAALEQEVEQGLSRPKECPIICQLPEGHGRLVDMNDVEGMFESAQIISDDDCNCGYVTDDLRLEELPTIVPAEEERS